jgi:hypothetical protein
MKDRGKDNKPSNRNRSVPGKKGKGLKCWLGEIKAVITEYLPEMCSVKVTM